MSQSGQGNGNDEGTKTKELFYLFLPQNDKRRKIQTVDKKKIEKKYYFYPKTGYPVFGFQEWLIKS